MSLAARHLEAHGIATVVLGCARDIVERAGAPRFLFLDFPLGNPCGRPHDPESQRDTLELALRVLEGAPAPRTTVRSPLAWSDDPTWKADYCSLERLDPDTVARRRREFDAEKRAAEDTRSRSA